MSEIVVTRGIREELDLRNLVVIAETIRTYEEEDDFDEFQVFDIKDNYIINKQEIPEREKMISLSYTRKVKLYGLLKDLTQWLENIGLSYILVNIKEEVWRWVIY